MSIDVRFRQGFAISLVVIGLICLGLGLLAGAFASIIVGAVNTLVGTLFMSKPTMIVFSNRVELKNMLGMTLKTVHFGSLDRVNVDSTTLWLPEGSKPKKVGGFYVRPSDMAEVAKAVADAKATAGAPAAA